MAHDILGSGPSAILLPALSSIATWDEMRPLAERLVHRFTCVLADWPGFGVPLPGGRPLSPELLEGFLDRDVVHLMREPVLGVAAGHGATYLVQDAKRHSGRYARLILIAPTWRGPLPLARADAPPGRHGWMAAGIVTASAVTSEVFRSSRRTLPGSSIRRSRWTDLGQENFSSRASSVDPLRMDQREDAT